MTLYIVGEYAYPGLNFMAYCGGVAMLIWAIASAIGFYKNY